MAITREWVFIINTVGWASGGSSSIMYCSSVVISAHQVCIWSVLHLQHTVLIIKNTIHCYTIVWPSVDGAEIREIGELCLMSVGLSFGRRSGWSNEQELSHWETDICSKQSDVQRVTRMNRRVLCLTFQTSWNCTKPCDDSLKLFSQFNQVEMNPCGGWGQRGLRTVCNVNCALAVMNTRDVCHKCIKKNNHISK